MATSSGADGINVKRKNFSAAFGPVLAAVHGDQDRHRHQRQLPEAVIKHQVERDKYAHHRRLLHQEKRVEDLAALLDRVPTGDHANRGKQPDQHHEPQAQPIHANVIEDCGALNPRLIDLKLEAALPGDKMRRQMKRKHEADERRQQCDPVGQLPAVGHQRNQHRSGQRNQKDQRENRLVDRFHSQCPATFQMNVPIDAGHDRMPGQPARTTAPRRRRPPAMPHTSADCPIASVAESRRQTVAMPPSSQASPPSRPTSTTHPRMYFEKPSSGLTTVAP